MYQLKFLFAIHRLENQSTEKTCTGDCGCGVEQKWRNSMLYEYGNCSADLI